MGKRDVSRRIHGNLRALPAIRASLATKGHLRVQVSWAAGPNVLGGPRAPQLGQRREVGSEAAKACSRGAAVRSLPVGTLDWVKTLLLNVTVAESLVGEYAELFRGLPRPTSSTWPIHSLSGTAPSASRSAGSSKRPRASRCRAGSGAIARTRGPGGSVRSLALDLSQVIVRPRSRLSARQKTLA